MDFFRPRVMRKALGAIGTWAMLLALTGCMTYSPMPLDGPPLIDGGRDAGDLESLTIAARSLGHPLLRPVEIGPDGRTSPQGAAVLAVIANPTLRAARDRAGVARAQLLAAGILPNPQLTASLDVPIAGDTQGTLNAFGLGLSWEVTSLITHQAVIDAADASARAVVLEVAWQEWQVALAAKLHAVRVLWLGEQLAAADAAEARAGQHLALLERGVAAGLSASPERDAAGAAAARRHLSRMALAAALGSEGLQLRQAIGLPPGLAIAVIPGNPGAQPALLIPPEALPAVIAAHRLDLLALRAGYESQESRLRAAIKSQFPKIGVGITRARDTTNVGTIGFGVTLDLPIFDRGQGRIAIEAATRRQLFDEFIARSFDAQADAGRSLQELASIGPQIAAADAALSRLESLESTAGRAVTGGLADTLLLFQVRNDLADARLETLRLRQQRDELVIAAEAATGMVLEGSSP